MRTLLASTAALTLLSWNGTAEAAWQQASSKHFVVYANDRPKAVEEFATRLERFDRAARGLLKMSDPVVGDGNRVTVYVLPTVKDVQMLARDGFIAGFYTGRVSGPLAYIAQSDDDRTKGVLYHEYAHHLMMQQLDQPYPEWYVEGFAEYLSTPEFKRDGSVGLGSPPQDRGWALLNAKQLPTEALLGQSYGETTKLSEELRESLYGRGWLLYHYLTMEPTRQGQLSRYVQGIGRGTPPLASAQAAFGDLKQLDKDLSSYLHRSTVRSWNVAWTGAAPPIEVRPLTEGASSVIVLRGRIAYGLKGAELEQASAQVRAIEARFPGDELVERTLAEVELEAGHAAAAEAAADRAVKAAPTSSEALILKGRAMALRADALEGDARGKFFDEARETFIAANKLDTENPEPLMEFYTAFLTEGIRPNANAISALHYASDLAPQDLGVRVNSAIAYLNQDKGKEARATLVPVAYSPHAAGVGDLARRMIAKIDAGDTKGALQTLATNSNSEQATAH